jgi:hypothetical protein
MKKYRIISQVGSFHHNKCYEGKLEIFNNYYLIETETEKYYFPIERTIITEESQTPTA